MTKHQVERRTTGWTFTCYPDSMPDDWEILLKDLHVPLAYILHDKDRERGILVKPHVHVLVKYQAVKALEQVRSDFAFTGIRFFEPVRSFNAMTRYLCHLDDKDKHQYPIEDVKTAAGISLDFSRHMSPDEQLDVLQEMTAFIEDNDIREFSTLWAYAAANNRQWLQLLIGKSSYSLSQYIKSRTFSKKVKR